MELRVLYVLLLLLLLGRHGGRLRLGLSLLLLLLLCVAVVRSCDLVGGPKGGLLWLRCAGRLSRRVDRGCGLL